jgi:2-haloacid dehalogenase
MRKYKALAFDVGGSVFNWKGAVANALAVVAAKQGIAIDAEAFALEWRKHLFLVLMEVRRGDLAHMNVDAVLPIALQRVALDFPQLELNDDAVAQLFNAWHSMQAWQDFPPALARLKEKYVVMVLTILSFSIVTDSSKASGISWDGVISCEFLNHYKPEPEAYLEGCALMGFKPEEVCLVAVHPSDLMAAKAVGMGTAFSAPQLNEPDVPGMTMPELPPPEAYDYYADSFAELADMMCEGLEDYPGKGTL